MPIKSLKLTPLIYLFFFSRIQGTILSTREIWLPDLIRYRSIIIPITVQRPEHKESGKGEAGVLSRRKKKRLEMAGLRAAIG